MKTNKIYELHYLSEKFYNKYNTTEYPEIENNAQRPYIVLLIIIDNNTFALTLRTNIRHSSCYKFKYLAIWKINTNDSKLTVDLSKYGKIKKWIRLILN